MTPNGKAPGCWRNPEPPREGNREPEVYARAAVVEQGPGAIVPRHEKEAAARAAVASIAMNEAGRTSNLVEKRERLELARIQLVLSLRRLELDLERLSA